ncbi:putative leucine-rich repeat domain superfamily [Helianthus annuus]|nr:putative leucine-rich repeat domain superfamily [Helianthus annuus]KAJ0958891.1 putative leucine-rich repeat domain superfamily [Helianthus annuus]
MYLQNLQYLILSYTYIKVLPESIVYLQNLKVLSLLNCGNLYKLPEGLRYMSSLQHLDISWTSSLMHLPSGVQELTSLKRLPWFPVGNESGAKIGELGDLNLLEGRLWIRKLRNVGGLSEAKRANLKCKSNLSVLHLEWNRVHRNNEHNDEEVLEGLEPNPYLKELVISGYMGKNISPSWMVKLNNLVRIYASSCHKCECIPALGRLPSLRSIKLELMDSLKCFHDDNTNKSGDTTTMFLSLQNLDIGFCRCLKSLPSNLPKLKVLKLTGCSELVSLPDEIQSFKDLNELVIRFCEHLSERYEKEKGVDWPKISHIPNIRIDPPRSDSEAEADDNEEDEDELDGIQETHE